MHPKKLIFTFFGTPFLTILYFCHCNTQNHHELQINYLMCCISFSQCMDFQPMINVYTNTCVSINGKSPRTVPSTGK